MPGAQHARDDLPEAPEACNDDAAVALIDGIEGRAGHGAEDGLTHAVMHAENERRHHHRQGDDEHQEVRHACGKNMLPRRECEQHEGELAAGRQRKAHAPGAIWRAAGQPADCCDHHDLERKVPRGRRDDLQRLRDQEPDIGRHSHRDEEQPQQEPLEGLDVRFELVAEFAVGEHDAGEEGAERHRQPHLIDEECRCDDD